MPSYAQLSAPRRSPSPRMLRIPPSPRRSPSPAIVLPAETVYMPAFPETQRPVEATYSISRTPSEIHHAQPVIYQASPTFSNSQRSIESTYALRRTLPETHYSHIYQASDSQRPIEEAYYSPPRIPPEVDYPQPETYPVAFSESRRPTYYSPILPEVDHSQPEIYPVAFSESQRPTYHPSPKRPSISKPRDTVTRRPLEATMIKGTNVNIEHANLNMTNNQVNKPPEKVDALGLLRSHSSPAALLDANERYDPPRCIEGTRLNVIRKLEDWIRRDSRHSPLSSVFWLYGGVGAGKSALAQTVAEKFKKSGYLAATFFFGADASRNDGNRLIPTLTLQLILESFRGLAPFVVGRIIQNPDLFKKSRRTQMFDLLVDPLRGLSVEETDRVKGHTTSPSHPRLIVIDGLDECSDRDIQCDLLQIIASVIPRFPYPLRFLITSRPESHITREFKHDLRKVARYNLSDDSDADEDIRTFLEGEFTKIRRTHPLGRHLPSKWPPRDSITSLVERSSGHFIYASTVLRFIQSPQHRPDDRLQVILGLKQPRGKDRPYARLDSLYWLIFRQIKDSDQLENIHRAFGIMHLRSLKSGLLAWPQWTSDRHAIEALLELRPGDLILLFDPLASLVTFEKDNIRILHKSLFDYLLDSRRSGDFRLDLGLAHGTAADYILKNENLHDNWYTKQFRDFAYHCQFTRLNDTLQDYLCSLASSKPVLTSLVPSEQSCLLQSMLYFMQVISRQDFDPSYYRKYVKEKTQCLNLVVPWSQRLKRIIPMFTSLEVIRKSSYFKRSLRSSFGSKDLHDAQLRETIGSGRLPIPAVGTSVIKAIKQEHELFSSYVKAHHQYPNIVVSFLEPSADLIHSCHLSIRAGSTVWMTFVMVVTYTNYGLRLSCSEFEDLEWHDDPFQENIRSLVNEHLRRTGQEIGSSHTGTKSYQAWIGPPLVN